MLDVQSQSRSPEMTRVHGLLSIDDTPVENTVSAEALSLVPYPCLPSAMAFFSFLLGAVLFRFAHLKPQACTIVSSGATELLFQGQSQGPKRKYERGLTLHKVFGPIGPFLHSGLSVLPQVTQTCNPSPSPLAPLAVGPATDTFF